jgi:micrococcal nuclease
MFEYKVTVDNVVDGDTVDVTVDLGFKIYTKQRIRLNGIDTPERGQAGYQEAKEHLSTLVLNKTLVMKSTKLSKWGYYLGDFYTDQGLHVNQEMIDLKLAKPYDGGTKS